MQGLTCLVAYKLTPLLEYYAVKTSNMELKLTNCYTKWFKVAYKLLIIVLY